MARVRINNFTARTISTRGAVRFCNRVMDEVQAEAFAICIVGEYATGRLARSIRKEGPHVVGKDVFGSVGSDLEYAMSVHDGAKVHAIFPKAAPGIYRFSDRRRPQLKFFWKRQGRVAYFPHIPGSASRVGRSHPGIRRGKKFLTGPLERAARRHNMRVATDD